MRRLFQLDTRIELVKEIGDATTLLEALEIDILRDDGRELIALCPYHDDRNPSWSMHAERESGRWGLHSCLSCSASGTVFQLVMHIRQCTFRAAVEWCEDLFGLVAGGGKVLDLSLRSRLRDRITAKRQPEGVAKQFEAFPTLKPDGKGWRYLVNRGLTRTQILASKVRKGVGRFERRVVFPLFSGVRVVSYYGRHIADGKPFGLNATGKGLMSDTLFNYHRVDPLADTCHLSESVFDALAIERCGVVNSFGCNGGALLPGQAALLRPFKRVVVLPDNKGGAPSLIPSCLRLLQDKKLYVAIVPRGKDPDETERGNRRRLIKLLSKPQPARRSRVSCVMDYSLPTR